MTSFFSGLLSSLKGTFFTSGARTEPSTKNSSPSDDHLQVVTKEMPTPELSNNGGGEVGNGDGNTIGNVQAGNIEQQTKAENKEKTKEEMPRPVTSPTTTDDENASMLLCATPNGLIADTPSSIWSINSPLEQATLDDITSPLPSNMNGVHYREDEKLMLEEKERNIDDERTKSPSLPPPPESIALPPNEEEQEQEEKAGDGASSLAVGNIANSNTPQSSVQFLTPVSNSEQDSFYSAVSSKQQQQQHTEQTPDSPEPMDIDYPYVVDDSMLTVTGHIDEDDVAADITHRVKNEDFAADTSEPKKVMSAAEEQSIAPLPAAQPVTDTPTTNAISASVLPGEEKPVGGKGAYVIDWDNFDENAVPCPFGGRQSSVGRPSKNAPVAAGAKRTPKPVATTKTEEVPPKRQDDHQAAAADSNANEVVVKPPSESTKMTKTTADKNAAEDKQNSNVQSTEKSVPVVEDTAPKRSAPSSSMVNKSGRQTTQQTAVVAPTVHAASATVCASNKTNQSAASVTPTTGEALRRPPIKASVNIAPHTASGSDRRRNSSINDDVNGEDESEEDSGAPVAAASSTDPFNNTAAFDYLEQAGSKKSGAGAGALHRKSLYTKFDPLLGGGGDGDGNQTQPQPLADGSTDVVSLNDITFTEMDESMLINIQTPVPKSSKQQEAPSTIVKKNQSSSKAQPTTSDNNNFDRGDQVDTTDRRRSSTSPNQGNSGSSQDAKLQFQSLLSAKEKEFSLRFQEEVDKRVKLERELAEMRFVVEEYDKTVQQLIVKKEKPSKQSNNYSSEEMDNAIKQRDQALEELQKVENAFSELHRRYETLRDSTTGFLKNEEVLKRSLSECQQKLQRTAEKYNKLYEHAQNKLDMANQEIERLEKARESDTLALRALVKKRELQIETLEKNLEQKQKEIQELTAICDELIQKASVQ